VSTHICCPSCDTPAANIASTDHRWGQIFDGRELDRAIEDSSDDFFSYTFPSAAGREIFECSCGRAIWIANRQTVDGRWFISAVKETTDA
jgi:hypothetical protein